ncbi:MAG: hypothetical protein MRZ79_12445 [Bacteroidia bacterium]|nr:hypothetical protein [Bacteroidia bacterium]
MSNITLIIGRMKSGKSTTIKEIVDGLKDKSLILNPGDAKAFKDFPFIKADQAHAYTDVFLQGKAYQLEFSGNPIRDISEVFGWREEDGKVDKSRAFLNGNLILEDAGAYLDSNLPRGVKSAIKAVKQHGLNLFLSYHSLSEISKTVLEMSPSVLILKKTGDSASFSSLPEKIKSLGQRALICDAFYRVRFKGLTVQEIKNSYLPNEFLDVIKEMRIQLKELRGIRRNDYIEDKLLDLIAKAICKKVNGKIRLSDKERIAGQYYYESLILRK